MSGSVSGQPVVVAPPSSRHHPQGSNRPGRLVALHSFALVLRGRMHVFDHAAQAGMAENIFQSHKVSAGFYKTGSESVPQVIDHKTQTGVLANAVVFRLQL